MQRRRLLILLSACGLMASGAWADEVGYVDCANHSEDAQVFAKARRTPDTVASIPCGEHFTVLIHGFIFSRIETRDGKVGYVYSSLISVDRSGSAVLQPASERTPVPRTRAPQPAPKTAQAAPVAVAQPEPVAVQPVVAQPEPAAARPVAVPATPAAPAPATAPIAKTDAQVTTTVVEQPNPAPKTQPEPAPAQPAPGAQPQPTPVQPAPAPSAAAPASPIASAEVTPAAPAPQPAGNATEAVVTSAPPSPATASQPPPAVAEPEPAPIRDASLRSSWEKPNPGARRRTAPIELFGGYAFARLAGGGPGSNMNGALGSFGWNAKPWLQIVADTSYSLVTASGTKNVLYGNHYGPRLYWRGRNRWGINPFVEALVGGSHATTTVSGTGGYTTSQSSISFKAGGGLDIHPSRYLEIRLFDVDYYRTSFGTNLHQNNYWASAGIVLRLFGGGAE